MFSRNRLGERAVLYGVAASIGGLRLTPTIITERNQLAGDYAIRALRLGMRRIELFASNYVNRPRHPRNLSNPKIPLRRRRAEAGRGASGSAEASEAHCSPTETANAERFYFISIFSTLSE